jgi:hypothetical protein
MLAALHDFALIENVYLVSILDGREAVGNGDGCATLHKALQGFLHQSLRLGIKGRGSLIENKDGRILQNGTGYGYSLALTA